MTNCGCDTFNVTPITVNAFSTNCSKITNVGTGKALYVEQISYDFNALEVHSNAVTQSGIWSDCTNTGTAICGSNQSTGIGVYGVSVGSGGIGVKGTSQGNGSISIQGISTGISGYGVYSTASGSSGVAVYAYSASSLGIGVQASAGKYGISSYGGTYGVYVPNSPSYFGGYITKAGGGFRIDHPTDPENKYLNHEFVESDFAKNVYDGEVVLDKSGEAIIKFADWFKHVNSNPRMTVSPCDQSMPNLFWSRVNENTFKISGGKSGGVVTYIIQCKRSDAWQKANHPGVEIDKESDKKGFFMHPEIFGKDESMHEEKMVRDAHDKK